MNYPKKSSLASLVKDALREDIGRGDITTRLIIPGNKKAEAVLLAKQNLIACGLGIAELAFKLCDKNIRFRYCSRDGQKVKRGRILAKINGNAQNILFAERVALNFLTLMCGIATEVNKYVAKVKPYQAKIMDTRKTLPGLRELEKYAVRTGGGHNHRFGLDEMVLIKDNHLKIIRGLKGLKGLTKGNSRRKVEIEVKNLNELRQALKLKPDIIMLDNMRAKDIRKAVKEVAKSQSHKSQVKLEASGGITLKNIRTIASTGVEMISVGALTHSVSSSDISLEIV